MFVCQISIIPKSQSNFLHNFIPFNTGKEFGALENVLVEHEFGGVVHRGFFQIQTTREGPYRSTGLDIDSRLSQKTVIPLRVGLFYRDG